MFSHEVSSAFRKHVEIKNAYVFLVWKPEMKGPLGKFRRRWEDNFKIITEVGYEDVNYIQLVQNIIYFGTI
jgi:hypothetical protein